MFNNKFFVTKDEALSFKEERGGGVLIELKPSCHKEIRLRFMAEMAVAMDARGEQVDPAKTPFCVAWNEPPFGWEKEGKDDERTCRATRNCQ